MDILWVIIFIIYIGVRTMGERKKGMERKAPTRRTPPKPPPRTPHAPQPVLMRHAAKSYKPVAAAAEEYDEVKPGVPEGQSDYHMLPYMEGVAPEKPAKPQEHRPKRKKEVTAYAPELVTAGFTLNLTEDNLRQAVIWSEILQQPRFRRGQRGYRWPKTS